MVGAQLTSLSDIRLRPSCQRYRPSSARAFPIEVGYERHHLERQAGLARAVTSTPRKRIAARRACACTWPHRYAPPACADSRRSSATCRWRGLLRFRRHGWKRTISAGCRYPCLKAIQGEVVWWEAGMFGVAFGQTARSGDVQRDHCVSAQRVRRRRPGNLSLLHRGMRGKRPGPRLDMAHNLRRIRPWAARSDRGCRRPTAPPVRAPIAGYSLPHRIWATGSTAP